MNSISFFLLSAIFSLFLYQIWKYLINPYIQLKFYEKQGFISYYHPYDGYFRMANTYYNLYNDIRYYLKTFKVVNPDYKGIAVNLKDRIILILSNQKLKKEYYLNKQYFERDRSSPIESAEFQKFIKGENNILISEGPEWKKRRSLISKAFNFEYVQNLPNTVLDVCKNTLNEYIKKSNFVNISECFKEIAGRSIAKSFFGEDISSMNIDGKPITLILPYIIAGLSYESQRWVYLIFGVKLSNYFSFTEKHRELYQLGIKVRNIVKKNIQKKYELFQNDELDKKSLLFYMFQANAENNEQKLTIEEIGNEYLLLLLAGTDTVAHILIVSLLYTLKNQKIYNKVQEEIGNSCEINFENIQKMTYLNSILKESLRMKNPVSELLTRKANKDHFLSDVYIKKNTIILPELISSGFDPNFFENAEVFEPERWTQNGKNLNTEKEYPYCFIPFSAGHRVCPGKHVALIEMGCCLAYFIRNFKLSVGDYQEKWIFKSLYELEKPVFIKFEQKLE